MQKTETYQAYRIEYEHPTNYLLWRVSSGGTVEIYDIVVGTERRKGIGRKLVTALLAQLPLETPVFAITRTENAIAQQFYENLGFSVTGVLRRFYNGDSPGADAVMYGRKAGGPV